MKKNEKKRIKICLAASAGGHLEQLLKLAQCWQEYDVFYVSTLDIAKTKLKEYKQVYIVGECNRLHPVRTFLVFTRCLKIVFKSPPNVVISTGAAPGLLMCIAAKFFGARIVWLDSIANVERLSLCGRIIRPFSDLVLTQWPELVRKYKNVEYVGAVI